MHMNTPDEVSAREGVVKRAPSDVSHDVTNGRSKALVGEFGFRPFPKRGGIVTNELIDQLRNEAGV